MSQPCEGCVCAQLSLGGILDEFLTSGGTTNLASFGGRMKLYLSPTLMRRCSGWGWGCSKLPAAGHMVDTPAYSPHSWGPTPWMASLGMCLPWKECDFIPLPVHAQSLQSCPTLCDPMDYSPIGSSVCGLSQARILEWVAISFSKGSSRPEIEPTSPWSFALQADSSLLSHRGSPSLIQT